MRCRPIKYTSITIKAGWTPAKEMAGVRAVRRGMQSRTIEVTLPESEVAAPNNTAPNIASPIPVRSAKRSAMRVSRVREIPRIVKSTPELKVGCRSPVQCVSFEGCSSR